MPGFREFLERGQSSPQKVSHPKYRYWGQLIADARARHLSPAVLVHRPEDVLGYKPAQLYLKAVDRGGAATVLDHDEWDADLDEGLIGLRVRAVDLHNEAQRYHLFLDLEFDKIERRYGDGFFKSVLVQYIREVSQDSPDFQRILNYSTALAPNVDSPHYTTCKEMIESVIANKARQLHETLEYSLGEITSILTAALVQNLDERFSVSTRRKMGLLKE